MVRVILTLGFFPFSWEQSEVGVRAFCQERFLFTRRHAAIGLAGNDNKAMRGSSQKEERVATSKPAWIILRSATNKQQFLHPLVRDNASKLRGGPLALLA